MNESEPKRRWMPLLLVLLPLWLIVSAAVGAWFFFKNDEKEARVEQQRFVRTVSIPLLEDDLRKLVEIIGERNASSKTAAANLTRTASMIEGLLGPGNTGYPVIRETGPSEWPLLRVSLKGKNLDSPPLWVVASYDSRAGSRGGEANASGLAATLAAAQALAGDKPNSTVDFIFLPHANDVESPALETAAKLAEIIKRGVPTRGILCVETMGGGERLWLSSRDTTETISKQLDGLGAAYGAELVCLGDDTDLASVIFEMNLPAVRISTRPLVTADENDDSTPSASTVAASTGRLIELIRRLDRAQ